MIDIKWIREYPNKLDESLRARGAAPLAETVLAWDGQRRAILVQLQELQAYRNDLSRQIGERKAQQATTTDLMDQIGDLKTRIQTYEEQERTLGAQLEEVLAGIPNIPAADVPVGVDETGNVEVRRWGQPTPLENPKPHYDLGEELGLLDFAVAAKMSGARFAWLQGDLARLERAIATYMLEYLATRGFLEVSPPTLVNSATLFGTGQLPKFGDDLFQTTDDRWLIPTAEVVLTNYARDEILPASALPKLFCAWTNCYRKEAGSAGRDTRGLIRMHQFSKVEMVQLVKPEDSAAALEFMTNCAEMILQNLGLPHRTIVLCTGDMGFCAQKTYDIEVWLPAQQTYREISSCSNCGDFQARRMHARYRVAEKETAFIHTLNGSGLAVGRTLVAVMENYQQPDGAIAIPAVLQPLMGGQTVIRRAPTQQKAA